MSPEIRHTVPQSTTFRRAVARALLLGLVLCPLLSAAEPDDVLRRLVASDVGLCIELSSLEQHWPELANSEIASRVRQSAAFRRWVESPDHRKLREGKKRLEALVGRPADEFLADLFGHSVVVAIYPSAGERAAGVLLVHAANDLVIREAVEIWNAAEAAQLEELSHAGQSYIRRTRSGQTDGSGAQFYWTSGAVLALSDDEAVIRRAIDLALSPSEAESIVALPEYHRAVRSLPHSGPVRVWFNPRAWDHAMCSDGDLSPKPLATVWNRCESIAASLRLESGVVIEAVADYDGNGVPEQWTDFVGTIAGPADFLERVPRRALSAIVGRHGLAALDRWIAARFEAAPGGRSARQVGRGLLSGFDPATDLLAALGPDWGAYLVPRETDTPDAVPVDAVVALKLSLDRDELRAAIDAALQQGMATLALFHNAQGPEVAAVVRSQARDAGTIRWIEKIDEWQPAAALTADSLVLGSSPQAVAEFMELQPEDSLASLPQFHRWRSELFPDQNQIAFVNLGTIRALLEDQREFFIAHSARSESISETEAESRLAELEDLLALADGAFLAAALGEQSVRVTCGLVVHEHAADSDNPPGP